MGIAARRTMSNAVTIGSGLFSCLPGIHNPASIRNFRSPGIRT
jgi:hypothetical protein